MSDNNKLIKGTIIYAVGNFGTKILSFLIVPLYTYYIAAEDMGNYDLLNSTINLLIPLITLQIFDAAFRWMIRNEDSDGDYMKSAIQIVILNSIIVAFGVFIISKFWIIEYINEFICLLITSTVLTAVQKLLRGLNNQKLFVFSSIIYTVVFLFFNLIQICVLKMGVRSLFISSTIANVFSLGSCFLFEKKLRINYFGKINRTIVKSMLKFSAPLIPNQLNWWVMNSSNRYIIRFFLGASANGIFAIAYKFPSVLQMLLGFFNTSWQDISVADKNTDAGEYYTSVFQQLYRLSFSLLWVLVPMTKLFILFIMSEEYKVSASYTAFLYLGTIFQSFASFYGVGYLRGKDTKQASFTSIYGAVTSAVFNIVLIRYLGLQAASLSTFLGFFIMWIIREKQNRQNLKITINKREFLVYFIFTLLACIISCMDSIILDIVSVLVGGVAFILCNRTIIINMIKKITRCKKLRGLL